MENLMKIPKIIKKNKCKYIFIRQINENVFLYQNQELDYNFLFDLAQGKLVKIYDTSRNKKESRALYQGVEFIRYVLLRRWFNIESTEIQAVVKEHTVTQYFETEYKKLSKNTKKKLDYVKKFVNSNGIHITRICKKSLYDGQYEYFKRIIEKKEEKFI